MSTSSSEIRKQLSALPFWGALTAREQETMQSCAQIRSYAILFTRLDQRIAQALLSRGSATVRITHEQLAGEINSTREAVSRILKDMERQSLIRLGRGQITLSDPDALRMLAGEENP